MQEDSAAGYECQEEAQYGAEDGGRDLAVFDVHPDEDEALDGQDDGSEDGEGRLPMECVGDDERDGADELDYAENCPGVAWECAE